MNGRDVSARVRVSLRHWSWIDLAAYGLIVAGLFLGLGYHVGLLALVALGAFGPDLLRELDLLKDRDELQRHTAAVAGQRAFLLGGLLLVAMIIALSWGQAAPPPEAQPLLIVLMWMMVIYLFTYAFSYWDVRRAATVVLLVFGLFWLAFVLLSHGTEPMTALMEGLTVPLPFLLGAWLANRWPRAVGATLVALSVFALFFFDIVTDQLLVGLLVPLPLAVVGLALLGQPGGEAAT